MSEAIAIGKLQQREMTLQKSVADIRYELSGMTEGNMVLAVQHCREQKPGAATRLDKIIENLTRAHGLVEDVAQLLADAREAEEGE